MCGYVCVVRYRVDVTATCCTLLIMMRFTYRACLLSRRREVYRFPVSTHHSGAEQQDCQLGTSERRNLLTASYYLPCPGALLFSLVTILLPLGSSQGRLNAQPPLPQPIAPSSSITQAEYLSPNSGDTVVF